MNSRKIMGFVLVSLLSACSTTASGDRIHAAVRPGSSPTIETSKTSAIASNVDAPSSAAQLPAEQRSTQSSWRAVEQVLKKDTPYATVRNVAVTQGWTPMIDPNCKSNVGGTAEVCDRLPEVEACSGDGYCKLNWEHRSSGVKLTITTYGSYEKWDVPGFQDQFTVRSWEFQQPNRQATGTTDSSCPSQNFTQFLAAFASSKNIRNTFTLPQIAVMKFTGRELETRLVSVPKEQYTDFSLDYSDGAFHHLDGNGVADPAPLTVSNSDQRAPMRLNIVQRGEDYFVSYIYGMSEGNSWLFKRNGDCWFLAEDPEAPSP